MIMYIYPRLGKKNTQFFFGLIQLNGSTCPKFDV